MGEQGFFREIGPPPKRAVMLFLRHNERIGATYARDEREQARERVLEVAEWMKDVSPTGHHASPETCRWRDYRATRSFAV